MPFAATLPRPFNPASSAVGAYNYSLNMLRARKMLWEGREVLGMLLKFSVIPHNDRIFLSGSAMQNQAQGPLSEPLSSWKLRPQMESVQGAWHETQSSWVPELLDRSVQFWAQWESRPLSLKIMARNQANRNIHRRCPWSTSISHDLPAFLTLHPKPVQHLLPRPRCWEGTHPSKHIR